jgi:hypothetical protein
MEVSGQFHAPPVLPRKNPPPPGTDCIGGWVDYGADLDVMENSKISFPYMELNPDSSVVQFVR